MEPFIGLRSILLWQAAGIVYVTALFDFVRGKKLTYKVTAKVKSSPFYTDFHAFSSHLFIALLSSAAILVSVIDRNDSVIIRFLALLNVSMFGLILGLAFLGNISSWLKQVPHMIGDLPLFIFKRGGSIDVSIEKTYEEN